MTNTCTTHASITHDIIDYKKSVRYSERVSQGVNKSKLDSTTSTIEMFQIESCVRGHHINKDNLESFYWQISKAHVIISRSGCEHNNGKEKMLAELNLAI